MNRTLQIIVWTALTTSAVSAAPGGNGVIPRIGWLDSYSANGQCYIDSTFDHGIGNVIVSTPVGGQTVRQVARRMGPGPGRAGNPVYNDVQCGNGPANNAGDEDYDQCPGRVDQGAAGCSIIGPRWNLERVYSTSANPPSTTAEPVSSATSSALACSTTSPTLSAARSAFSLQCATFTREDCDPIYLDNVRVWMCASYRVENGPPSAPTQPVAQTVTVQPSPQPGGCDVLGENLSAARRAYAEKCTAPRLDCDPTGNGSEYRCASYKILSSSLVGAPSVIVVPPAVVENPQPVVPAVATPAPTTGASNSSSCDATGATLSRARNAYAAKCSLPRKDCDPVAGGYKCASYTMGNNQPAPTNPVSNPSNSPSTTSQTAATIHLEAESQSGQGWINRGDYIEFTGVDSYASATYGSLTYNVTIPASGDWEMRWRAKAAQQTPGRTDLHNDAWVKMNGQAVSGFHDVRTFRKMFSSGNGNWQVGGTVEIGNHNFTRFRQRFTAGTYQLQISGRSSGYAIDYIEFVQINQQSSVPDAPVNSTPVATGALPPLGGVSAYLDTFNQPYRDGDLLSLHWDSSNDPDDMQAMILTREILDAKGGAVDFMAVNGAKRVQNPNILSGSTEHMRTLFPSGFEAWRNGLNSGDQSNLYNNTVAAFATAWALTLSSGNRVHVADGGPSNFTASVIEELLRRGVAASTLKNIRVIQHSWGANEIWTTTAALNTVRRYASYIRIANGNAGNGEGAGHTATPDYELKTPADPQCTQFRPRALASQYRAQWQTAFAKIRNKCDGSDAVEVVWILGIPTNQVPTLDRFADRYF